MPHYAYARSDKKDAPRISIGGRLVADLLVTAGVNRVLTLTLHSPEVHGFFSVPVDHLHALRELAAHFSERDLSQTVVLSPDLGYAKSAAHFARRLGVLAGNHHDGRSALSPMSIEPEPEGVDGPPMVIGRPQTGHRVRLPAWWSSARNFPPHSQDTEIIASTSGISSLPADANALMREKGDRRPSLIGSRGA